MRLRGPVVSLAALVLLVGGARAATARTPHFSFSTASAIAGDDVVVRVAWAPKGVIRLYLVRRGGTRTRNFIGTVTGRKNARLLFTVPPLSPGMYDLAYARGRAIKVQRSPSLRIAAPAEAGCPATTPNGNTPPAAPPGSYHGDANLWALLPPDGMLRFAPNAPDTLFNKMLWVGRGSVFNLAVEYRRVDVPSPSRAAETVRGTLSGYNGPSWASRMYFQPGCWLVSGRTGNGSLSFVVLVVRA